MIADHRTEKSDVGRPQSEPVSYLGCQLCADDTVIPAATFTDVVHEGTENEQVRPRHSRREGTRVGGRFHQVSVHRPRVDCVPRR